MKRSLILALVVSMMMGLTATGQNLPEVPPPMPEPLYKRVNAAIEKGTQALLTAQLADGSWGPFGEGGYHTGPTAIALYALLEAGVPAQDPRMVKGLQWLAGEQGKEARRVPGKPDPQSPRWAQTYELGLRCNVWYLANQQTKGKYNAQRDSDAELLEKSTSNGSWGYAATGNGGSGDNSVSQLATLGMSMATRGGYEVDNAFWQMCLRHWVGCQRPDGGFAYSGPDESSGTMTAAGLASLFICYDKLYFREFRTCNVDADFMSIDKALQWLDDRFIPILNNEPGSNRGHGDIFYLMYGVERSGLASGYKYFGTVDWFTVGAEHVLRAQNAGTGVFAGNYGPIVSTSFALLFLVRGQNAVVFNKLQFESDGGGGKVDKNDWNCRPRDLAFLTGWINNVILETPINWQIVNLNTPVEEWHDAHILYIAGSKAPKFTDEDKAKLKQFVLQGGMIFSVTECNGQGFSKEMKALYKQLFPQYRMEKVSDKHPIYTIRREAKLNGNPPLEMITNGIRPLVVHCEVDLAKSWQMNTAGTEPRNFQIGNNLFMYITDSRPKKRGSFIWPAAPEVKEATDDAPAPPVIEIGRVEWKGDWNPEPLALERFTRMMSTETGLNIQEVPGGVKAADAGESTAKVLILSGTGKLELTPAEREGLKAYVVGGGTLVVDPAGGNKTFADSYSAILDGIFGVGKVAPLMVSNAEILNVAQYPNGSIGKLRIRSTTQDRLMATGRMGAGGLMSDSIEPSFRHVRMGNRVAVYVSREDFTNSGLVGYQCYGVDGFNPEGNYESPPYLLLRNIMLVALKAPTAEPAAANVTVAPEAEE